jgi:DNA-binding Lrp family transcriptional regulator
VPAPEVTERVQRLRETGVITGFRMEDVLDRVLLYGPTVTSIVGSTPVPPRAWPLPGDRRPGIVVPPS